MTSSGHCHFEGTPLLVISKERPRLCHFEGAYPRLRNLSHCGGRFLLTPWHRPPHLHCTAFGAVQVGQVSFVEMTSREGARNDNGAEAEGFPGGRHSGSKSHPTVFPSRSIITPFTDRLLRAVRSSQMRPALKE